MDADAKADSRWLLRGIGWLLVVVLPMIAVCWIAFDWPAEKVGNGYQLLGLFIAALGIPIVSPWLASVERRVMAARDATAKWLSKTRSKFQTWWARLRGRPREVNVSANLGGAAALSGSASLSVTYGGDARDLAIRALEEIGELRQQLDDFETASREETQRRIDSLRTELQEHVLSITREGWHYIVGGAGVTAIGIIITLLA